VCRSHHPPQVVRRTCIAAKSVINHAEFQGIQERTLPGLQKSGGGISNSLKKPGTDYLQTVISAKNTTAIENAPFAIFNPAWR
jgi:hypothetical protein